MSQDLNPTLAKETETLELPKAKKRLSIAQPPPEAKDLHSLAEGVGLDAGMLQRAQDALKANPSFQHDGRPIEHLSSAELASLVERVSQVETKVSQSQSLDKLKTGIKPVSGGFDINGNGAADISMAKVEQLAKDAGWKPPSEVEFKASAGKSAFTSKNGGPIAEIFSKLMELLTSLFGGRIPLGRKKGKIPGLSKRRRR